MWSDITIEITLAPSDVLMLSPSTPTLISYTTATNNEINLSTAAGAAVGNTVSQEQVILYLILVFK